MNASLSDAAVLNAWEKGADVSPAERGLILASQAARSSGAATLT